ncbi:hypothetical protein, partial [Nitrobacter sp.]|uniref:hypothetical protein n=1 Tax=Nitrobacter sp. TaxID=29420 RepID=UPI003F64DBC7
MAVILALVGEGKLPRLAGLKLIASDRCDPKRSMNRSTLFHALNLRPAVCASRILVANALMKERFQV